MNAIIPLAHNAFREARRNRITVVVALFAILLLFTSTLLTELTVVTFDRVLVDVGLGTMSLFLALLAIFLSSTQISREIERRTIYLIVTKPVSRATFLLGRFAGNMATLIVLVGGMALVYALQLLVYGTAFTPAQGVAIGMLASELLVLSSIGFALSSFAGQVVSSMVATALYFAGHLSADIYNTAARSKSVAVQYLGKFVYYVVPDLERFNFRPAATYHLTPSPSEVLSAIGYGFAYTVVMLSIAVLVFNRRDFR